MNKIRLMTFLVGLILLIIGITKIILIPSEAEDGSIYTPAIIIIIGGMMMLAVRRK